jgi:hypothetical protein
MRERAARERDRDTRTRKRGAGGVEGGGMRGGGSVRVRAREPVRACVSVFVGRGGLEHTDQGRQGQR